MSDAAKARLIDAQVIRHLPKSKLYHGTGAGNAIGAAVRYTLGAGAGVFTCHVCRWAHISEYGRTEYGRQVFWKPAKCHGLR